MKLSKDIWILYAFAVICSIYCILRYGVMMSPDGATYINAWDNIADGKLDILRTPVYPVFLGSLKIVFGEHNYLFIAICIQHLLFLYSLYYFYCLAQYISQSRFIQLLLTAIYAASPLLFKWYNYILTEPFAISCEVLLVYIVIKLFKRVTASSLILFTVLLTSQVFLRPALIYMLPVYFVIFLICILKKEYKLGLWGLATTIVATLCILLYMRAFEKEYDVFALSSVSTNNQTEISRQYGLLNPDVIDIPELRDDIIYSYEQYGQEIADLGVARDEVWRIFKEYDLRTRNEIIHTSYKSRPKKWILSCFNRLYISSRQSFFQTHSSIFGSLFDIIGFKLSNLYFFIILYTLALLFGIAKWRHIPSISLVIYMLGVCNIVVAIIGAQDEWNRLIMPSMPLYLLMFGQLCTMLKMKPTSSIDFI